MSYPALDESIGGKILLQAEHFLRARRQRARGRCSRDSNLGLGNRLCAGTAKSSLASIFRI